MAEGDLGSAALGSVFKPSGKLTVLHNFMGAPTEALQLPAWCW